MYDPPSISHASELQEKSTWRMYKEGIRELTLWEAPKSVIQEFRYKAARTCFLAFADLMKDGALKVAPFHEIIGSAFEDLVNRRYRKLIISCPPRSGKSMLSALFLAWLLGIDGESQHIIASYGQLLSNKLYKETLGYLKTATFKRIFPEWKGFVHNSKYDFESGGYILSTSVGGVLTGFTGGTPREDSPGIGVSLIDDPIKNSNSKKTLDNLESWWGEELSTRRTNHYAQVVVGTRFHERDLHGILIESNGLYDPVDNKEGWRWINIQGIIDTEEQAKNDILGRKVGETHWPDNPSFTPDMVNSQRTTMGSSAFYALFMGTPTSNKGQIVQASWVNTVDMQDVPDLDVTWVAVDCAFSEGQTGDETAVCVAGISYKEPTKIYIREVRKGRWGFPELIAQIKMLHTEYQPRVICIEKAASGQSLLQVLRKETRIPVEEMKPIRSKTMRLEAVCPLLESARVKIVIGEWTKEFIKELTTFPFSTHDDSTDAFVWALTYYALKLDSSDRSMPFTTSVNRQRFQERGDTSGGTSAPAWNQRGRLQGAESGYNDPDYNQGGGFGGQRLADRGRFSRRNIGYESPLF